MPEVLQETSTPAADGGLSGIYDDEPVVLSSLLR